MGGWLNPLMIDYFEDFSRIVFMNFADRVRKCFKLLVLYVVNSYFNQFKMNQVPYWITINEPQEISKSYSSDTYAPAIKFPGVGEYISSHNLIKAHARAYRLYEKDFKPQYGGKVVTLFDFILIF